MAGSSAPMFRFRWMRARKEFTCNATIALNEEGRPIKCERPIVPNELYIYSLGYIKRANIRFTSRYHHQCFMKGTLYIHLLYLDRPKRKPGPKKITTDPILRVKHKRMYNRLRHAVKRYEMLPSMDRMKSIAGVLFELYDWFPDYTPPITLMQRLMPIMPESFTAAAASKLKPNDKGQYNLAEVRNLILELYLDLPLLPEGAQVPNTGGTGTGPQSGEDAETNPAT